MAETLVFEYGPARPHPEYARWAAIWRKCRDVLAGEEAIKDAGATYLPRMEAMNDAEYEQYKTRAMFYGASYRTIGGLMGALLRHEPITHVTLWKKYPKDTQDKTRIEQEGKLSDTLYDMLRNVTQTGVSIQAFTRDLASEILSVGRVGLLVDMPPAGLGVAAPYLRLYRTENILNWRERYVGGVPILEQVVLQEVVEQASVTGFGSDLIVQYRELTFDEAGDYIQRVYIIDPPETDKDEPSIRVVETIKPKNLGRPLKELPFFFIGSSHMKPEVERPPLLDLYNVNVSHYRSSADLEHGRHFTAMPTPVVSGVEDEDENGKPTTLRIGAGTAWLLPQGAQARMLEFNGQGLKHLENALTEKEKLMVNLGARMLEQDKRASETAEALRLRQAGDIASLNVLADTISAALTRAVRIMAWWAGHIGSVEDDSILIALNKDFYESRMAPGQISALVSAWQAGAFSFKDLYDNLVRGEIIDGQREYEDVRKEIDDEAADREAKAMLKLQKTAEITAQASAKYEAKSPAGSPQRERPGLKNDSGNRPRPSKAE